MRTLAIALAVLGGCRVAAVEPRPLAGPPPERVAVWPSVSEAFAADEAALLTGLDAALRARGYRTLSVAVARQILGDAGLWEAHDEPPREPSAAGRALMVDALLTLEVREFDTSPDGLRDARWDLVWRLCSTRGGGVLWEHAHRGAWSRSAEQPVDASRRLDAEPDVVPLGGEPGFWFRDAADLAANLHRLAMAHLPRSPR